jgi:periplasmic divalent cation tolerance protein
MSACIVLVTAPRGAKAASIARDLVRSRLAACVNVVHGVRSIYRWEGTVSDDREDLLVIKTTRLRFPAVKARVLATHPYDCPEVLALPVAAGNVAYLRWIADGVSPGRGRKR